MKTLAVGASATALVATGLLAPVTAASAETTPTGRPGILTVAKGLDGPRQIEFIGGRRLVVAESDTGEITRVNIFTDQQTTLVTGLASPQGVSARGGKLFIATGGTRDGSEEPSFDVAPREGGPATQFADTLAYELENNPDEQVQFVDGEPVDTLSNPYYVLARTGDVLLADAGANAILRVDRYTGAISTFAVLPVITGGPCAEVPNNPGTTGCDPVPTGIDEGPDGKLYVSTLGSEVPGAARVYRLDATTGAIEESWGDLTGATGVAVGDDGSIYVSELFHGAPQGPPPPDFDPSQVGRVVKIAPDGGRTYAQVTMPSGMQFHRGDLYVSAWSIAGFLGLQGAGEIVRVTDRAWQAE